MSIKSLKARTKLKLPSFFTQTRPVQDQSHQHSTMGRGRLMGFYVSLERSGQWVFAWAWGATWLGGRATGRLPVRHQTHLIPSSRRQLELDLVPHQKRYKSRCYLERKRPFNQRGRGQNRLINCKTDQMKWYACIKL